MSNPFPLRLLVSICALLGAAVPAGAALEAAPISPESRGPWSERTTDPFDGSAVYDRHSFDNRILVTRWSRSGIGASLHDFRTEREYVYVPRHFHRFGGHFGHHARHGHGRFYSPLVSVSRRVGGVSVPAQLLFTLGGTTFRYTGGPVGTDLAAALAAAPNQDLPIEVVLPDGERLRSVVGRGTVATWREIFGQL